MRGIADKAIGGTDQLSILPLASRRLHGGGAVAHANGQGWQSRSMAAERMPPPPEMA